MVYHGIERVIKRLWVFIWSFFVPFFVVPFSALRFFWRCFIRLTLGLRGVSASIAARAL